MDTQPVMMWSVHSWVSTATLLVYVLQVSECPWRFHAAGRSLVRVAWSVVGCVPDRDPMRECTI